ncbi:hypothetical protein B0T17DRAFT_155406 [Bombardia bombarda]|uniref:Uncharacterized protein n=1 Tax=Bombardia bombarda TaxID=252184 RepID=A0AA40C7Y0_9PEZI|nr:hypothetical protein B0T17DRAFT_155406 [Bombardia bombarda]
MGPAGATHPPKKISGSSSGPRVSDASSSPAPSKTLLQPCAPVLDGTPASASGQPFPTSPSITQAFGQHTGYPANAHPLATRLVGCRGPVPLVRPRSSGLLSYLYIFNN